MKRAKSKKAKKVAKKPAKLAQKAKKAEVRHVNPKKRAKTMVDKRSEDEKAKKMQETERENAKKPQAAQDQRQTSDRGTDIHPDKPLTPSGEPAGAKIDQDDPMGTPPDTELSPVEAARAEQGDKVDLSGSPGSAGEPVPVSQPDEEMARRQAENEKPGKPSSAA